ncbi:hypothetical protein BKA70DRAFT_1405353 [Coprinopsis sp. MPI-PUGE-AT-0042]|nr:hypothetical protein BKA70DRAFT_1405353 [Coprinopsis sp. MPI-PUGE-AT-0042]
MSIDTSTIRRPWFTSRAMMNAPTFLSPGSFPPRPLVASVEGAAPSFAVAAIQMGQAPFSLNLSSMVLRLRPAHFLSRPSPSRSPEQSGPTRQVSFDKFKKPQSLMFSVTMQAKSAEYKRTKTKSVYLCAAGHEESRQRWIGRWRVGHGRDEVTVSKGVDEDRDHDIQRQDPRALFKRIQEKWEEADPGQKLSLNPEYIPGAMAGPIDRLITLFRPDSVVAGTRGRKGLP